MRVTLSLTLTLTSGPAGVPSSLAARITGQLAAALAYLHGQGCAHRDVKPANVMLMNDLKGPNLTTKLVDFGFAIECGDERQHHKYIGTPAYMAPELIDESLSYLGPPVDMWALGAVVYELIHGRMAFSGVNDAVQLYSRIRKVSHQPIDTQVVIYIYIYIYIYMYMYR